MMSCRYANQLLVVLLSVLILCSVTTQLPAAATEDPPIRLAQQSLEEYKQQRRDGMQQRREDFQEYLEERSEAYREFYEERRRKFEKFKQEIASKWGQYNVEVSTKKKMTSYSDDKTERSTVDFQEGEARAEVLVDRETAEKNPGQVQEKLRSEVEEMVTKSSVEDEVTEVDTESEESGTDEETDPERTPTPKEGTEKGDAEVNFEEPILADQVRTGQGEEVNEDNADEFAGDVTSTDNVEEETVRGEDGRERVKASVEVDLVPDHTEKRARKYLDRVEAQANRFDVDPGVLLAVMHTESSFNPKARSHIPAYGLMQLVPGSGGKAAYRHIYGEEKLLEPDYLYRPENNIELGAGYLNLVYSQYLDGIENDQSRLYCAIASYNTGPGNLAKTFVDSMSVNEAEKVINTMTPEQVYRKLRNFLPYDETKRYIKKVRDRRETYEKWLSQIDSA